MMKLKNIDSLKILNYPAPVLLKTAKPVETFDGQLAALATRMFELMRNENGVGLAAPQVGVSLRMFICNVTGEPEGDLVVVNPSFAEMTGAAEAEEGCLSLPEVTVMVRRATTAVMNVRDLKGNDLQLSGEDLMARVWQHEVDHLDGRLILDYMSATDEIANRRAIKQLKDEYKRTAKR